MSGIPPFDPLAVVHGLPRELQLSLAAAAVVMAVVTTEEERGELVTDHQDAAREEALAFVQRMTQLGVRASDALEGGRAIDLTALGLPAAAAA